MIYQNIINKIIPEIITKLINAKMISIFVRMINFISHFIYMEDKILN